MDFIETVTLTGARQYVLAAIHHASRLGAHSRATTHPTHAWVTQAVGNRVELAQPNHTLRSRTP